MIGNTFPMCSVIFDVSRMQGFSARGFFLQVRQLAARLPRYYQGSIIVVGAGDLIKTMVTTIPTIQPRKFSNLHTRVRFVDSLPEAGRLLVDAHPE